MSKRRKTRPPGRPPGPTDKNAEAYRRALWYIQRHYSPEIIARLVGVHDNTARRWYASYWLDKNQEQIGDPADSRTVGHILCLFAGLKDKSKRALAMHVSVYTQEVA